ncbi:MAG: hypothetical protein ACYCX4_07750 [Bacillota bacterium]
MPLLQPRVFDADFPVDQEVSRRIEEGLGCRVDDYRLDFMVHARNVWNSEYMFGAGTYRVYFFGFRRKYLLFQSGK